MKIHHHQSGVHAPSRWCCMWPVVVASVVLVGQVTPSPRPAHGWVGAVVGQVTRQYLAGCHLVLVTDQPYSATFTHILREVWGGGQASLVVTWGGAPPSPALLQHLAQGDPTLTCRAIIIQLSTLAFSNITNTSANITNTSTNIPTSTSTPGAASDVMRLLEEVALVPETRVVLVGPDRLVPHALQHPRLHDTLHALYLATHHHAHTSSGPGGGVGAGGRAGEGVVTVYRRCLYCRGGNSGVILLHRGINLSPPGTTLFPETFEGMQGHVVRIVAKDLFPYVSYERDTDAPGTTVTPKDSLDVRMLDTVATSLNFTYVIRAPVDGQWGGLVVGGGGWTGMVGQLGRGEADFSLRLFWSAARKQAIDFTRAYIFEPFVMITRKPGPFPQHLAPVRPFTGEVWVALVLLTTGTGVVLWAVQRACARLSGGRGLDLPSALLDTWGMLLEDPLTSLPANITVQVVVGSWWLFCVVVVAMYRSSLIAHLTAPVNPPPIDTLEQLLAVEGTTWGLEGYGVGWDWFKYNTNPQVQQMFTTIQVTGREEQVQQVLGGRHAFFSWRHHMETYLALHHTDARGHTPLHISREELISGQSGWGVRRGAPFLKPLDRIIGRLAETGLIVHWLKDITETSLREARQEERPQAGPGPHLTPTQGGEEELVLSLGHLQGAFYLLLLGCCLAALTLLMERCISAAHRPLLPAPHTPTDDVTRPRAP